MEGNKAFIIVTMPPIDIQMVAMDSLLVIHDVFYLILRCDKTGQKKVHSLCSEKQKISMDYKKDF